MRRLLLFCWGVLLVAPGVSRGAEVDYSRDIKPILASACYNCHGPDQAKRKANLRLDVRESAIALAVRPGQSAQSELIRRVLSTDPNEVMPPPRTKKKLTPEQIAKLRQWIDAGAPFDSHWAFVPPQKPPLPQVRNTAWAQTPIDTFILAKLEQQGLTPVGPADRVTLLRRLAFDLTGLPPTPEDAAAFLRADAPISYEALVDRLLASPHFGERMAVMWLDLVRYADTGGYHSDNHRDIALFRDYVIQAFNQNKPFDRFTLEQLAGDLLPNPTNELRIASGYNRLLMTTEEGGAQAKEYTAKYAADRVRNVSSVWLGSTMGCAECHDHKYDPFKTKDFYSLAAFFADVAEVAVGRQPQTPLPTPEQAQMLQSLDTTLAQLKADLNRPSAEVDAEQTAWEAKVRHEKPQSVPKNVLDALAVAADQRTSKQQNLIRDHFRQHVSQTLEPLRKQIRDTQAKRDALMKEVPTTLVSMSVTPRVVRILPRGNWLDDSGEVVQPNVPAFLPPLKTTAPRATRRDLAEWITSPENPLTARVYVNRLWKIAFGQGLVRTGEDFGTQGVPPTHPELLDWLAVEFRQSGWDTKRLLKQMVLSNAYRMSSIPTPELVQKDPNNLFLGRQNRYRLDAEFIRDNALAVSGLLSRKVGGNSVKPYQPSGYWAYLNFPKRDWLADKGADQYRRGLYTYWCRSFLHPSLLAFDAPTREECTADRPRSSTPLQALVLLNDPTYVEAARVLAQRILREGGATFDERLHWVYRQVLTRAVRSEELPILQSLWTKHREDYQKDLNAARQLLTIGDAPLPQDLDLADLAAWTSVARVLLNLHETVTRN